ncbi:copper-binding transcription factor [Coemansia sp. RSA 2322]|uniref:Copper-binding transcription factor n=1 Tax=Coemansia thaxteri TaxID=2663907 RepID=A0A9W8EG03_9FUNG|nr:copper-binding transcription factor [Coemansia thaxteri]KAJ2471875.1 copper-binding transcription factor [Coemansia sp. RSA 2322]KAJ2485119.1 copper-binding transcription factor [Coemansia sp. RSA 2320]
MIFQNGKKFACEACIRGHRASTCNHKSRTLKEIRPKGRPVTQCERCRELRKSRKAHVKCLCGELGSASPTVEAYKVENLLNPCKCSEAKFCACCRPMFSEYLNRNYPSVIVEETANSFRANLMQPISIRAPPPPAAAAAGAGSGPRVLPACPMGPNAPCCKPERQPHVPRTPTTILEEVLPPPPYESVPLLVPSGRHAGNSGDHGTIRALDLSSSNEGRRLRHATAVGAFSDDNSMRHSGTATGGGDGKPDCKCGCDCGKKLDMLIQAIEARIGAPVQAMRSETQDSDTDPSEWIDSILTPLAMAVSTATAQHRRGSDPATLQSRSSGSSSSTCAPPPRPEEENPDQMLVDQPEPLFADDVGVGVGVASPSCCALQAESTEALAAPDGWTLGTKSSCCSSAAPTLVAPALDAPAQASCCSGGNGNTARASQSCSGSTAGMSQCCSGGAGEGSKCGCCKKRKQMWQPGDPDNPEVDEDGALACSCGCHKPFEECTDCLEDLCEDVLLKSAF